MSSAWRRTQSKLEEGRRTKGKNKGAAEMFRCTPRGAEARRNGQEKKNVLEGGERKNREFLKYCLNQEDLLGVGAELAFMDDR